jgi:hypothetical protein
MKIIGWVLEQIHIVPHLEFRPQIVDHNGATR